MAKVVCMQGGRSSLPRIGQRFLVALLVVILVPSPGLPFSAIPQDTCASNPQCSATLVDLPPAPIPLTPLNRSSTEDTTPLFSWTECVGASSYTLELDRAANLSSADLVRVDNIHETQFTPSEGLAHGQWFWHVRAVNASGPGQFSATMEFGLVPSRTIVSDSLVVLLLSIAAAAVVLIGILIWYVRLRRAGVVSTKDARPRRFLSPRNAAVILAAVGAVTPYAVMFRYFQDSSTLDVYMLLNAVAVPWSFVMTADSMSFELVSGSIAAFSFLMISLHLAYVIAVFDYCKELTTKLNVLAFWFLSQIPVLLLSVPYYLVGAFPESVFYSGPTFFTLLAGYVLMKLAGPQLKDLWKEGGGMQDGQITGIRTQGSG